MNRIILIGNGFDKAHGLPTGYRDFMSHYWKGFTKKIANDLFNPQKDGFVQFEKTGGPDPTWTIRNEYGESKFCSIFGGKTWHNDGGKLYYRECEGPIPDFLQELLEVKFYNDLYVAIMKVNELSDLQFSLSFENDFWKHISEKTFLETWFDIENEYYCLLKSHLNTENRNELVKKLNKEFCQVKDLLKEYLTEICEKEINKKESIENVLESAVDYTDVALLKIEKYNLEIEKIGNAIPCQTLFLNFNYTNTAQKLYTKPNDKIINIHGELNNEVNQIIFGYGDELDDDYKEIEKTNNNDFLENIKSIHYHNTNNYRRLLEFLQDEPYQVFVMGHSCGNSDRTLLNTIFEHPNCISIKPFYYQWEDEDFHVIRDNYTDIVKNISRNFNNKQNMRDIVVNKEYCKPLIPAQS